MPEPHREVQRHPTAHPLTHFQDGTSGSPGLVGYDPKSYTGTVIGVLCGHEGGGDQDDVSYAAYFDDDIAKLYRRAQDED